MRPWRLPVWLGHFSGFPAGAGEIRIFPDFYAFPLCPIFSLDKSPLQKRVSCEVRSFKFCHRPRACNLSSRKGRTVARRRKGGWRRTFLIMRDDRVPQSRAGSTTIYIIKYAPPLGIRAGKCWRHCARGGKGTILGTGGKKGQGRSACTKRRRDWDSTGIVPDVGPGLDTLKLSFCDTNREKTRNIRPIYVYFTLKR